jgi:hypothetical protein
MVAALLEPVPLTGINDSGRAVRERCLGFASAHAASGTELGCCLSVHRIVKGKGELSSLHMQAGSCPGLAWLVGTRRGESAHCQSWLALYQHQAHMVRGLGTLLQAGALFALPLFSRIGRVSRNDPRFHVFGGVRQLKWAPASRFLTDAAFPWPHACLGRKHACAHRCPFAVVQWVALLTRAGEGKAAGSRALGMRSLMCRMAPALACVATGSRGTGGSAS